MLNKLFKNRNGTAEVIASIMFIVILLFFFSNIYLWHDAAAKDMNNLYTQKINSPITVALTTDPYALNVTNKGGVDAKLCMLWINEKSPTGGPDIVHKHYGLVNVVPAGSSIEITLTGEHPDILYDPTDKTVTFRVITTVGNSAACSYTPPQS
jgi:hypothetical protein